MEKVFLWVIFAVLAPSWGHSAIYAVGANGTQTIIADLATAATAVSYADTEIHVTSAYTINDVTFPVGRKLIIDPGGAITVNSGKTLTAAEFFGGASSLLGPGLKVFTDSHDYRSSWFDTLARADASAVAASKTLIILKQWDTVPSTITANVRMGKGGKLKNSGTVTFTGGFEADKSDHFIGSGAVTIPSVTVFYPQWWGDVGGGANDDSAAFRSAAAAARASRGTLAVDSPRVRYKILSTVIIDSCNLIGEIPTNPATAVGQFVTTSNINVFLVKGSRMRIENIGLEFSLASLATSGAVGFLFGDFTTQFSRSSVKNCFVRNAYDSFKANSSGTGTLWEDVWEQINSDLHVNLGVNFDCVNGSTTLAFINAYVIGNTASGNKPKGFYFNNTTDLSVLSLAADCAFNEAFKITNCQNFTANSLRMESCHIDIAGSSLIALQASNSNIKQIFCAGLIVDVGVGNSGYIVSPATRSSTTIVGTQFSQFTVITSGTLLKFKVVSLGHPGALTINDPLVVNSDIFTNGYDTLISLNGKFSVPTAESLLGTWGKGAFVYVSSPVEAGKAHNKYVIIGWTRITNGAGNVVGTDWLQARFLTGN